MGLRAEILESGLAAGCPVRAATTSIVLDAGAWLTGRPAPEWEAEDVVALAWYGVVAWCRWSGVDVPDDAAVTVARLAAHLDAVDDRGLVQAISEVVDPVALSARRQQVS